MWWSKKESAPTQTAPTQTAPSVPSVPAAPAPSPAPLVPAPAPVKAIDVGVDPASFFTKYGTPIPTADIAKREEFISCYNRALRNPHWVIEHLTTASTSKRNGNRQQSNFKEDTAIPLPFRARLADYFRSGFDRGHLAAAANAKFSQPAIDETFFLTNMSPQVGDGFNRDYWAHFERFTRNLTKTFRSVYVITGPLYLPQKDPISGKQIVKYEVIGNPPNVAVPTHFFKIIIGEQPVLPTLPMRGCAVGAFVLPNEPISNDVPLTSFKVPLNAIERAVGVEFMPKARDVRDLCMDVRCQVDVVNFIEQTSVASARAQTK